MSVLSGLSIDDNKIQQHILHSEENPIKPIAIIDSNLEPLRKGEQDMTSIFYQTVEDIVKFAKSYDNEEFTGQDYEDFNQIARSTIENDFKIDFDEEVRVARQGMARLINQLNIPIDLKRVLAISLDSAAFDTDSNVITMQPTNEDFFRRINLSPAVIFAEANILARSTKQELSPQMIRTLIHQSAAHELGHLIDHTVSYRQGFQNSSASVHQIAHIDWDYPIDYQNEGNVLNPLKEIIIAERFAGFFAKELIAGLPDSSAFLNDAARVKIGFGHIKQLHIEDLVFTIYAAMAQLEENSRGVKVLVHTIMDMVICNNSLAEIFSFKQDEVEKILIQEYEKELLNEK
ncbi:hypothetical protein HYV12_00675 [Candidatus Dojkabacteria bacterium]|nr:hypothetical protein [Candidatus Dojkabacteria bacterium]